MASIPPNRYINQSVSHDPQRHLLHSERSHLVRQPSPLLVITLLFLFSSYLTVDVLDFSWLTDLANLVGPLLLGLASMLTVYKLVRRQPIAIWTPYAWFLGAIALFYSIGPLIYMFSSTLVRVYLDNSLPITVTSTDLLHTNLLNVVGIGSILIGISMARIVWLGPLHYLSKRGTLNKAKVLTLWLLIIGGALEYLLIIPWEFGVFDFILPGLIYNLGKLFLFGLVGMAYITALGERRWKIPFYTLWSLQVIISILHFSKSAVVLSLLLPVLGGYLADGKFKRLLVSGFVMIMVYISVAQLVHYGRQEVYNLSGTTNRATLNQRLGILVRWINGDAQTFEFAQSELSNAEIGWARLSYVNVQTYAINSYDSGMPGDTLKSVFIVLIPRVIWPDKPLTTDIAKDFYEVVTGWRLDTYLGLGLFGEGYWNLGWFGVILLGVITGVIFWIISGFAIHWMRNGSIEYLPGIYLGINMGILGITDFFTNAIIGGAGFILIYTFFVSKVLVIIVGNPK